MHIKQHSNTVWNIHTTNAETVSMLQNGLGVSEFLARLIEAKGFENVEDAREFIHGGYELLHDPYLLHDMDRAVSRIEQAIADHERILIYGDYDVDGVTSVSLLLLYLRSHGADADYYIPERVNEGYGLNSGAIERAAEKGVKLIITVDSGITASEEIEYAKSIGIETVITDHHECREKLPDAVAVVNPHRADSAYPFQELAGVGVVFKLVCALEKNQNIAELCRKYADIAALGTVADVMPIIGENRIIVKIGLKMLSNTSNAGLRALIAAAFSEKRSYKPRDLTAASISFGLAPRINAAGRIGDVNRAVALLISEDTTETAAIADYLCYVNRERQLIENEIFTQAVEQIESTTDFDNDKVIILTSDSWHLGVIGIVASKITDRYGLPSILISFDGDTGKGSGRSVKGFNINEAISYCKEYLTKYGGHELAAGLTITRENVPAFRKMINDYARANFDFDHVYTYLDADFELTTDLISEESVAEIAKLEPYGLHNNEPLFYMRDMDIREITSIGEGKHCKLTIEKDGKTYTGVYFGMAADNFPYPCGMKADFLFTLGINEFRGIRTVQLYIRDVRPESELNDACAAQTKLFEDVSAGVVACPKEDLPELPHFRTIFTFLRSSLRSGTLPDRFSVFFTAARISSEYHTNVSACMLHIALAVFAEMGLIKTERFDGDRLSVTLANTSVKIDLNDSAFYRRVRGC